MSMKIIYYYLIQGTWNKLDIHSSRPAEIENTYQIVLNIMFHAQMGRSLLEVKWNYLFHRRPIQ